MKQLIVSVAGGFSVKIATLSTRLAFGIPFAVDHLEAPKDNTRRPIHMEYIVKDMVKDTLFLTSL